MPSSKTPQVARCDDFDDDKGKVKSGSGVEARRPPLKSVLCSKTTTDDATKTKDPQKPKDHSRSKDGVKGKDKVEPKNPTKSKEVASDSGYSSHASDPRGRRPAANAQPSSSAVPTASRPEKQSSSTKTRPSVGRIDTRPDLPKAAPRSSSASRPAIPCNDIYCAHAVCYTARYPGHPLPSPSHPGYSPQYHQTNPAYPYQASAAPAYQYPQVPQLSPTSPQIPQTRPRTGSLSGAARPMSFHEFSRPLTNHGPPPSNSAYHNAHYLAMSQGYPDYYADPRQLYNGMDQTTSAYSASPVATSPVMARAVGLQRPYSARVSDSRNSMYDLPSARAPSGTSSSGTASARQPSLPARGILRNPNRDSYILDPESESDSESVTSSQYSESEPEFEYEPRRRHPRRDSQTHYVSSSGSSTQRPPLRPRYATEPAQLRRAPHEPVRRIRTTDTAHVPDYLDYSDNNMDSDRTERAVVDERRGAAFTNSSRSSRHPSFTTTTSSSGRTRETGLTSASSGGASRLHYDDHRHWQQHSNLPHRPLKQSHQQHADNVLESERTQRRRSSAAYHSHSLKDEHDLLDSATAYQERSYGARAPPLTAENIRQQTSRSTNGGSRRGSNSHNSNKGGADRHGADSSYREGGGAASVSASSRRFARGHEGLQIMAGDTVVNLYGESSFGYSPAQDGVPAQLHVGIANANVNGAGAASANGFNSGGGGARDSAYYGSGSTRAGGRSSKGSVSSSAGAGGGLRERGRRRDTVVEDE